MVFENLTCTQLHKMDSLLAWDEELFLFLNGLHSQWLDPVMLLITKTVFWIPLYLIILFFMLKNYKKNSWIIFIGIGLAILLADQTTSGFMKPFFERLRPSQNPTLAQKIHLVDNYIGGLYGFASGHAANTFATAFFFFLLFKPIYKFVWLLFIWAGVMTYTRIYLGVHYPGDILAGAAVGLLCGWIGYRLTEFLKRKFSVPKINVEG